MPVNYINLADIDRSVQQAQLGDIAIQNQRELQMDRQSQRQQQEMANQRQMQIADIYRQSGGDLNKAREGLYGAGFYEQGGAVEDQLGKRTRANLDNAQAKNKIIGNVARVLIDNPSKELALELFGQLKREKVIDENDFINYTQNLPDAPEDIVRGAKVMYGMANEPSKSDPYYTAIPTEQGLGKFNARTGEFELMQDPTGKPLIKSSDSPTIRGGVKEAEARAASGYDINTSIPGIVSTDRQIAEMANPSLGGTQLPSVGTPQNMRIAPNVQAGRDDMRMRILEDEQRQAGGVGMNPELDAEIANMSRTRPQGIQVPTKAQEAAELERAKRQTEIQMKAQDELPQTISQAEESVKLIDDLLKSPGYKQAVGASRLLGIQKIPGTDAKDFDIRLDQLKGKQFLQAFETLKGGGQITEVEGKKATDAISRMNPDASEKEFERAAKEFQDIIKKGLVRARAKAGRSNIMPKNETMPTRDVRSEADRILGL